MDKLRANCIGINYIYKKQQACFDMGIVDTKVLMIIKNAF